MKYYSQKYGVPENVSVKYHKTYKIQTNQTYYSQIIENINTTQKLGDYERTLYKSFNN